jgi:tRNA(fMet)-specific endonuclease VapC
MFCLDTNVVVALMNGRRPAVRERFAAARVAGAPIALSAIALFELRFGAANSARPAENQRALDEFVAVLHEVVAFDPADAAEAGEIRTRLKASGAPIGPYDILIAAQARRRGATMVTSNIREFGRVPGLLLVDWAM